MYLIISESSSELGNIELNSCLNGSVMTEHLYANSTDGNIGEK